MNLQDTVRIFGHKLTGNAKTLAGRICFKTQSLLHYGTSSEIIEQVTASSVNFKQRHFVSRWPWWVMISIFVAQLLAGQLSAEDETSKGRELLILGASTLQPLMESIAEEFESETGIQTSIQGGGGEIALVAVRKDHADIGMISRALTPEESAEFTSFAVAREALAVVGHAEIPQEELSKEMLAAIYRGEVKYWDGENGGTLPIFAISRAPGRVSRTQFRNFLFGDNSQAIMQAPDDIHASSNLELFLLVSGIPGAIGYVSFHHTEKFIEDGMPIKIFSVDGILPSTESVADGTYPLVRQLTLIYKPGNELARYFIDFLKNRGAELGTSKGWMESSLHGSEEGNNRP